MAASDTGPMTALGNRIYVAAELNVAQLRRIATKQTLVAALTLLDHSSLQKVTIQYINRWKIGTISKF